MLLESKLKLEENCVWVWLRLRAYLYARGEMGGGGGGGGGLRLLTWCVSCAREGNGRLVEYGLVIVYGVIADGHFI